jgi:hypothetical protein
MKRLNSTLKGIFSLITFQQGERFTKVVFVNNKQTYHTGNRPASIMFSNVSLR